MNILRRTILTSAVALTGAGVVAAAGKPKSVIHVITVRWKEGATPAQIKAALDGVERLGEEYRGIKNTWTRAFKVQDPTPRDPNNPKANRFSHVIVMEFESEEALEKYAGSAAQKKWYEVYMPIRDESFTHDVTN